MLAVILFSTSPKNKGKNEGQLDYRQEVSGVRS